MGGSVRSSALCRYSAGFVGWRVPALRIEGRILYRINAHGTQGSSPEQDGACRVMDRLLVLLLCECT